MLVISSFPSLAVLPEAFLVSALLIIFTLPILYMFLYRPILLHVFEEEKNVRLQQEIAVRQKAERELVEQVKLLSLGAEVGAALTLDREMEEMLQRCCESIVTNLDATFARIWTLNEEENILQLKASAGLYTNIHGEHSRKPIDNSNKIGNIALTKKPHLTNSVVGDPQILDQQWIQREGIVAFAGHPLLLENRMVGVMALFSKLTLSDATIKALASVADQIALGIERKNTEDAFYRVNRALRVLSKCNEILTRAQDEQDLFQKACSIIVDLGSYRLAWIGLAVDDEEKTVSPVSPCGTPDNFLDTLGITWSETERGRGPTGTAIRTGKTVICKDVLSDPAYAPWKEVATKYGYRSSIALPLSLDGRTIGALNIYAVEANAFDIDEVKLLEELASDVSYGVSVLRVRINQKKTEEEKSALQKQIRQMQKMQAIGTLAGGIAHDFNNLLTPILGYASLIRQQSGKNGSKFKESLDQIINAGNRAKELVQQILTFSRQTEHERKPLQLQPIIKETVKLLRSTIPSTIEFHENIQPDCGTILANATEVHQIIMNLCTNAYHAMLENGGILEISLKAVDVDPNLAKSHPKLFEGGYIELTVKDTGHGMDAYVSERIFEPFFTTKVMGEGTGMGLAMVHGIVESLNGAIIVESEKGKGSAFHVYLPQFEATVVPESKMSDFELPRGQKERVLLVDDEESIITFGQNALNFLGYDVTTRTSSIEALALFKSKPAAFDLVITDQVMPNMSGTELCEKMVGMQPNLPVILLTGFSQQLQSEKIKKIGIREFIMKPIIISELATLVRKVLDE